MNQCDGCQRGLPVNEWGHHRDKDGVDGLFACTANRYAEAPVPAGDAPALISEQRLREMRDEARSSPEAEHTVWWLLLCRAVEREIGAGYVRLHAACKEQKDELLRTWAVLAEVGLHPGRTDDRLSDVVRAALSMVPAGDVVALLTGAQEALADIAGIASLHQRAIDAALKANTK